MQTYLVLGFRRNRRNGDKQKFWMLVDVNDDVYELDARPADIAERIAGKGLFCFPLSETVNEPVSEDCKNILFQGDDELYARMPQLDRRPKKRKIASKR